MGLKGKVITKTGSKQPGACPFPDGLKCPAAATVEAEKHFYLDYIRKVAPGNADLSGLGGQSVVHFVQLLVGLCRATRGP